MKTDDYKGIRKALAEIIKGTPWEGHLWLVGGCVRDEIMHQEVHDVDIAVSLPNGGIRFACWLKKENLTPKRSRLILFEKFGTAKVRLKQFPKEEIDCVQTRKGRYQPDRKQKAKENFGNLTEDALCRDITINSLYRNVTTGQLLDPTGMGLSDIEQHIIRTPNNPDMSLRDNAMHILRCIRFAVKYDWRLTDDLIEAMKRNIDILEQATAYRMTNEVSAIMALKDRRRALRLISMVGAMPLVQPYLLKLANEKPKAKSKRRTKKRRPRNEDKSDS